MSHQKTKKGFTIIEVVLVLAIAGLIFLMVFLALPALQRSQKDTQRRDQLSMLVTQITQYQANNRNRLPTCSNADKCVVDPDADGKIDENDKSGWAQFYRNYLLAQNDVFEDPNGNPYRLQIVPCDPISKKDGEACSVQRSGAEFSGAESDEGSNDVQNYRILITTNSVCDGENIVYNTGARRLSVAYKLEGGGMYCSNN